jgi:response regulator RpfG family c-di-GMP phosphodiesterase
VETKLIKELKCLVLFKDKNLFKDILAGFNQAHVSVLKTENEHDYLKQAQNFQPHFTIIEVDSTHPEKTQELITKHRLIYKNSLPIFLVGNAAEAALILQCLELGATDFFQRPLDFDLIATKIGKYFLHEELLKRELSYAKVPIAERSAKLEFPMKLVSINEKGVVLKSPHIISKGAKLDLGKSSLKQLLGIDELIVTVMKTQPDENDNEIIYAEFPEDEIYGTVVRKLILSLKKGKGSPAGSKS